MRKTILLLLLILGVSLVLYVIIGRNPDEKLETKNVQQEELEKIDEDDLSEDVTLQPKITIDEPSHTAKLIDVTGGNVTFGVDTKGESSGVAKLLFDGEFKLYVEMSGLPEPTGTVFYEGWLVREDPLDFFSTGEAVLNGDIYIDTYKAEEDYSEYDYYVLTVKPDDSDPAPGVNILEGSIIPVEN